MSRIPRWTTGVLIVAFIVAVGAVLAFVGRQTLNGGSAALFYPGSEGCQHVWGERG